MSAKRLERTLRRMLLRCERLNESNALQLKELILKDGYISKSEQKLMEYAIEHDLLDDAAFEVFLDLVLDRLSQTKSRKSIA